jgi:hypothetical protein
MSHATDDEDPAESKRLLQRRRKTKTDVEIETEYDYVSQPMQLT